MRLSWEIWEQTVNDLYLEADGLLDVVNSELFEEAFVLTPEQPDVWDAVQNHGQPLQAQTERPAHLVSCPGCKKHKAHVRRGSISIHAARNISCVVQSGGGGDQKQSQQDTWLLAGRNPPK